MSFPVIHTLEDILPATEGRDEILVANRGTHTVVNYLVVKPDTFPPLGSLGVDPRNGNDIAALRRECRGLIFDADGKIIRRPLHKFFNINEREETLAYNVDLTRPHDILTKEDGSSISPVEINGVIHYGTRMGPTEIGDVAGQYAVNGPLAANYMMFVGGCIALNLTPVFEWCSRAQRIVIDHPEDRLVLLAVRDNVTGVYEDYQSLIAFGEEYNIPVVQPLNVAGDTAADLVAAVRALPMTEYGEGIVIRFRDNGEMMKAKSDEYCLIHNAKERILEERYVVEDIINGDIDDVMATVLEDDRKNIEQYRAKFWDTLDRFTKTLQDHVDLRHRQYPNRKDYALSTENKVDSKFVTRAVFWFYMEQDKLQDFSFMRNYVIENRVRPALGTRTNFGEMKNEVLPNIRFKY